MQLVQISKYERSALLIIFSKTVEAHQVYPARNFCSSTGCKALFRLRECLLISASIRPRKKRVYIKEAPSTWVPHMFGGAVAPSYPMDPPLQIYESKALFLAILENNVDYQYLQSIFRMSPANKMLNNVDGDVNFK